MKITCNRCGTVADSVLEAQLGTQYYTYSFKTGEYEREEFAPNEMQRVDYLCVNCGEELDTELQEAVDKEINKIN